MIRRAQALVSRELQVESRRLAPHLVRLLLCVLLLGMVFYVQLNSWFTLAPGLELFGLVMSVNIALGSFIVPMYLASAIGEEKEQRTLPLLRVADVGPATILLGKLVPLLFAVAAILLAQLPFIMLSITLGGVLFGQIAAAFVSLAAWLLAIAGVSLCCSVWFSGNVRPVAYSLCLTVVLLIGAEVLDFWVSSMTRDRNWGRLAALLLPVSDTLSMLSLIDRQNEILGAGYSGTPIAPQVIGHFVAAAMFLGLAYALFRRYSEEWDQGAEQALHSTGAATSSRRCWRLAIAWKEFTVAAGGRRFAIARFFAYGFLIACTVAASEAQQPTGNIPNTFAEVVLTSMLFIILPFETVWMSVRLFALEASEQTLGTLMILPRPLGGLVGEKVLGGLISMLPVLFYPLAAVFVSPTTPRNWIWEVGLDWLIKYGWGIQLFVLGVILLFLHLIVYFSLRMTPSRAVVAATLLTILGYKFIEQAGGLGVRWLASLNGRGSVFNSPWAFGVRQATFYDASPVFDDRWLLMVHNVAALLVWGTLILLQFRIAGRLKQRAAEE